MLMNKMLQEKIMKASRSLKTFKSFLDDSKVKNNSAVQDIAQYWPEIEAFLKDSKIVFEFEGYFRVLNELSELESITSNIYNAIDKRFRTVDNSAAWDRVNRFFDEVEDDSSYNRSLSFDEYLDQYFQNAARFYNYFSFTGANEGTSIADKIKEVFNTEVIASDRYHQTKKQDYPDHWFIEHDGSLTSSYKHYQSFEIVSPYLSISEAPKILEQFKTDIFDYFEGITNPTTGFHINITCSHDKLDFIKLVLLADDHRWLKTFDREFNDYCQSQYKQIKETIEELPNGLKFEEIVSKVKVRLEKYTSFNFLKTDPPTVEFRVPGDDYLGRKFVHSKQALDWLVFMIAVGLNRNMFRQEYMAKIMRIYNNSRPEIDVYIHQRWMVDLLYYLNFKRDRIIDVWQIIFNDVINNPTIKVTGTMLNDFSDYRKPNVTFNEYRHEFAKEFTKICLSDEFIDRLTRSGMYSIGSGAGRKIIRKVLLNTPYETDFLVEQRFERAFKIFFDTIVRVCSTLKLDWQFLK
jgi:hypothetical protein